MNVTELLGAPVADTSEPQQPWQSHCSSRAESPATVPPQARSRRPWLAVALVGVLIIGGAGGWMMARATVEPAAPVTPPEPDAMPSHVAATAELFTKLYLAGNTTADLETIYAGEPPPASDAWINDSAAVAGHAGSDGVWSVTVAVDALEPVDGRYQPTGLSYFLVTIVTDGGEATVLAPPSRIPAPQRSAPATPAAGPVPTDQLETTIRFLEQYLTGGADLPRYMAAAHSISTFAEPPYETVEVTPVSSGELGRIRASVVAMTSSGASQQLEYILTPVFENGVWVIADLGAP